MSDFEVVIVGGGPAGAATALFLSHLAPGLRDRILVIDKATFPRDKICAGAIAARADRLLQSIGVHVAVPSVPVAGLRVTARCGTRATRLPGRPIARVVRRFDYDAALLDQLRQRQIEVREGVALRSLDRRAAGVMLSTSQGTLSARVVVGADGVGSTVRRQLGLPAGRFHAQAVEVDTPWTAAEGDQDLLSFDMVDNSLLGYAWDFPTLVDGEPMACRGIYQLSRGMPTAARGRGPEQTHRLDLSERLRKRLQRAGIEPAPLRLRRYAERGLALHEPCGVSRVLLVGEAAGIDPVLGEGIAQAIHYGKTAGEYLASRMARGEVRFGDYRAAVMGARVGLDLRIRAAMVPLIYGRTRRWAERWMIASAHLGVAGASYFGGRRVSRLRLLGAGLDLVTTLRLPAPWSRRR